MPKVALLFLLILGTTGLGQTPRAVEDRLLGHLSALEKSSNYGGTADYEELDKINIKLKADLVRLGRSASTLAYRFPRLKGKMFISTSTDGRFRVYSWDEETGGTMHDFESVFQFKDASGKVQTWTRPSIDDDSGGFFHDVFQVTTKSGPAYLAVSTGIASSSLAVQSISAFQVKGNSLNSSVKIIRTAKGLTDSISFAYDFFSVVDHPERPIKLFKFDEGKRSFSFPVVIEDENTPQGRVTNKLITYRFNGSYFVKAD